MILNVLLYFANKGSLKTLISSCKSHNQCKPPEATQLKKNYREIMVFACVQVWQTSQANILHLN